MDKPTLPPPARYFPLERGVYEIVPGLKTLGHNFGNGPCDGYVFQFDHLFSKYRDNKLACRAERLSKYYQTSNYLPAVRTAVHRSLVEKLCKEHPSLFTWTQNSNGGKLLCALTQEEIELDADFELRSTHNSSQHYESAFDALCSQVQEDIAVMSTDENGKDWLAALHLCSGSHWGAEDKIGKNFFDIHAPVPGIEKVNNVAKSLVEAMIHKGPYVRFVWLFATDDRLNHHPEPPPGHDLLEWKGQSFNPAKKDGPPLYMRVERQVLFGLPNVRSFVFTIRTSFNDGEEIRSNPRERDLLRSAFLSMTPDSRRYKGLKNCMNEVIDWLNAGS